MSLLTEFPSGYRRPEPLNKSFDMTVRDWSRQQFGGDDIVDEIRKALNTGVMNYSSSTYLPTTHANAGGIASQGYGNSGVAIQGNYPAGSASALRLENLDNTMTSVLATAEHLKIFRFLHKEPSKQPFYQWNRRESYGSTRGHFGFAEGSAPTGGAGQWSRNGAYVKFLGTRGGVTHPAVLTNILGGMSVDPVAEDQLGRTMDFMQRIERAIMYGDEDILDSTGSDSNYDGLLKQLTKKRSKNIIDMKGKPLTMDVLANTASRLVTEGKLLSFQDITLFMSPQNIEDFGKLRYSTVLGGTGPYTVSGPGTTVDRSDITSSARNNLLAGLSIVGQSTSFGVIPFEWSIFTEPVEGGAPLVVADSGKGVPTGTPVHGQVTISLADNAAAGVISNMEAGNYAYAVAGVSDAGESAPILVANPVTGGTANPALSDVTATIGGTVIANASHATARGVAAGDSVLIRIAAMTDAKSYRVYRCKLTSTTEGIAASPFPFTAPGFGAVGTDGVNRWQYVGHLPGTAGTFIDRNGTPELYNNFRAGTNIAPLICRNSADLCIAQMSPLLKMPLAPTSTTFEYLLLLYHTLVLKSPERQFIFKNVGALN